SKGERDESPTSWNARDGDRRGRFGYARAQRRLRPRSLASGNGAQESRRHRVENRDHGEGKTGRHRAERYEQDCGQDAEQSVSGELSEDNRVRGLIAAPRAIFVRPRGGIVWICITSRRKAEARRDRALEPREGEAIAQHSQRD